MSAFLQVEAGEESGDFRISRNNLVLTDGKEEVRQLIRSRLRVFRGEWFLDTTVGTPYYQSILGKNKNQRLAESEIKAMIIETPGVVSLLEFSFNADKSTRVLSVTFKVRAEDGILELTEVLA